MRPLMLAALVAALPLTGAATAPPAPPAVTVHIRDDAFVPHTVTIVAGQTVAFVNDDDDAHTATADDESWDSEGLSQGQSWAHAFAKAGTVKYHCTVHPMMHGVIVVRSAP
jgi:plastocyanin